MDAPWPNKRPSARTRPNINLTPEEKRCAPTRLLYDHYVCQASTWRLNELWIRLMICFILCRPPCRDHRSDCFVRTNSDMPPRLACLRSRSSVPAVAPGNKTHHSTRHPEEKEGMRPWLRSPWREKKSPRMDEEQAAGWVVQRAASLLLGKLAAKGLRMDGRSARLILEP